MIKQPFGFVSTCFGHGKTGRRASDDSGLQLCSVSESLLAHSKLMIYLYVTVSLACLWMQCAQSCLVCARRVGDGAGGYRLAASHDYGGPSLLS